MDIKKWIDKGKGKVGLFWDFYYYQEESSY